MNLYVFFFSSRRRHTRFSRDWSSDVCSSDLTRNHGDHPLFISQALHSYFAVSDIRQVQVEGLHGCRYIDTLEDWQPQLQQGAVTFSAETDRIYLGVPSQISIRDPQWQRRIHLLST